MSSGIPSAQPIPSYPSIWPEPLLGDCEAAWGPPLDPSPSFFSSFCFPGLLSHFVINVSSSNQIMIDGCKVTGWRNATLFEGGGHEIDTVVTLKRPICQLDRQGCLEGRMWTIILFLITLKIHSKMQQRSLFKRLVKELTQVFTLNLLRVSCVL